MSNYIIGVDGGGTKTLGVLYNLEGKEIKRYVSGFSNFNIDYDQATNNLFDVLDHLTIDLKHTDELWIQLGISGYSKIREKESFEDALGEKYHAKVSLESDVLIALYDVKKTLDVNVIMVIGGTGSVVMYSDQQRLEQIGGFGHLLGDEGSAYHLSITALKDVIDVYEDKGSYDEFGKLILEHLNVKHHFGIRDFVYANEKTKVADISTFIDHLARNNHEKAIKMIEDEAKSLARQTIRAYLKMHSDEHLIIALRGGFLTKSSLMKKTFLEEIDMSIKDYEINESDESPVRGAYYLSLLKLKKG
jgi:N-acetylglucosamine kinase-like BadF-type ATPase